MTVIGPLKLNVAVENWPLTVPFRITGYSWDSVNLISVSLEKNGHIGRGEAQGVYYKNETPASMVKQIESVRDRIEAGISRESLLDLLPLGGARCAVDCA